MNWPNVSAWISPSLGHYAKQNSGMI